jgi:hypothetical protein
MLLLLMCRSRSVLWWAWRSVMGGHDMFVQHTIDKHTIGNKL